VGEALKQTRSRSQELAVATYLITALSDDKASVRQAAAFTLGELRPGRADTIAALTRGLADGDRDVRRLSARALAAHGPDARPAVRELLNLLADEVAAVRAQAAVAIAAARPPVSDEIVGALIVTVGDTDDAASEAAARALGTFRTAGRRAVPALLDRFAAESSSVRSAAGEAIVRVGAEAIPDLIRLIRTGSGDGRRQALATLAAFGQEGRAAEADVARLVDSSDQATRLEAALALAVIAPESDAGLSHLVAALDTPSSDDSERVRIAIRRRGAKAVPGLVSAYRSGPPSARPRTAAALALLGKSAVRPLCDLLRTDGSPDSRAQIISLLTGLSIGDDSADEDVLGCLNDPAQLVQVAAVAFFNKRRRADARLVPAVLDLLRSPDQIVRRTAAEALPLLESKAAAVSGLLAALLRDQDSYVSQYAARFIGQTGFGDEAVRERLLDFLAKSPTSEHVHAAILAMGPSVCPGLIDLTIHPRPEVRARAADLLSRTSVDPVVAAGAVSRTLQSLDDAGLSWPAEPLRLTTAAAARVGQATLPAVDRLLGSTRPSLRLLAAEVLAQLPATNPAVAERRLRATRDLDPTVRQVAIAACAPLDQDDQYRRSVEEVCRSGLRDSDLRVRNAVRTVLRASPRLARGLVPTLVRWVNEGTKSERSAALSVLDSVGSEGTPAVTSLLPLLEDPNARHQASAALTAVGSHLRPAVPELLKLLTRGDAAVRSTAVDLLVASGSDDDSVGESIARLFEDPDFGVRNSVDRALRQTRNPRVVPLLARHLSAPVRDTKARAIRLLGAARARREDALSALLNCTDSDLAGEVTFALAEAYKDAPDAAPAAVRSRCDTQAGEFVRRLNATNDDLRRRGILESLLQLGKLGASAVPDVTRFVEVGNDQFHRQGAGAMQTMSERLDEALMPAADRRRRAESRRLWQVSIRTLGQIGRPVPDTVRVLRVALVDDNDSVRAMASGALAELGPGVVDQLRGGFEDTSVGVRRAHLKALRDMGEMARPAIPDIRTAASDVDPTVRILAVDLLWALGERDEHLVMGLALAFPTPGWTADSVLRSLVLEMGEAAVPLFTHTLGEADPYARWGAVTLLEQLDRPVPGLAAVLLAKLSGRDPDVTRAQLAALRALKAECPASLLDRLAGGSLDDRRLAASLPLELAQEKPVQSADWKPLLRSEDEVVRNRAAGALVATGSRDPEIEEIVVSAVRAYTKGERGGAAGALAGQLSLLAVPTCRVLLNDPSPSVRSAAVDLLGRYGPLVVAESSLVKRLWSDPDQVVRGRAACASVAIGCDHLAVMPILLEGLNSGDPFTRFRCAGTLGQLASAGGHLPPEILAKGLGRGMTNPDPSVRVALVRGFASMGIRAYPNGSEVVIATLDVNPDVRREAGLVVSTLRSSRWDLARLYAPAVGRLLAAPTRPTIIPLAAALDNTDTDVRASALQLLAVDPAAAAPHRETLMRLMEEKHYLLPGLAERGLAAAGRIDRETVVQLTKALGGNPPAQRTVALLRVLGEIGPAPGQSVGIVAAQLKSTAPGVKWAGFYALLKISPGGPEAQAAVRVALAGEGSEYLSLLPDYFAALGPAGTDWSAELERGLAHQNREVRRAAARSIGTLPRVPAVTLERLTRLAGNDPDLSDAALRSVGELVQKGAELGNDAAEILKLTRSKSAVIRAAAESLARSTPAPFGPLLATHLPAWTTMPAAERRLLLPLFAHVGPSAPKVAEALVDGLKRDPADLRHDTFDALRRLGPAAGAQAPRLLKLADGWGRTGVLYDILDVIIAAGPAAEEVAPRLRELLEKELDDRLRAHCLRAACAVVAPDKSVELIIQAMDDKSADIRRVAAALAAQIGPAAAKAVPKLKARLADDNPAVRSQALHTLVIVDPAGYVGAANGALVDRDPPLDLALPGIIDALGSVAPSSDLAANLLMRYLENSRFGWGPNQVRTLQHLAGAKQNPLAVRCLETAIGGRIDWKDRLAGITAFHGIRPLPPEIEVAVRERLSDESAPVRELASELVGRPGPVPK